MSEKILILYKILNSLGNDFEKNIQTLTELCGTLTNATCALYNRLEENKLIAVGQWNTPNDFVPIDKAEGHICYDIIQESNKIEKPRIIQNLSCTKYFETDPNVSKYKLETYVGHPVILNNNAIGSLCVVFQNNKDLTDEEKQIIGIIASVLSFTEKSCETKKSLKFLERKINDLFDRAPVGIFQTTLDGKPITVNKEMANILGFSSVDEVLKFFSDIGSQLYVDKKRREEFIELIKNNQIVENFEYQALKKDGSKIWLSMNARIINSYDDDSLIIEGFTSDITKRIESEQNQNKLQNQLLQIQKLNSIGKLAGGIAHDLNNLLTPVLAYSDLLLDEINDCNQKESVKEILNASLKAKDLVGRLLVFSKKQNLELTTFNLNESIIEFQKLLRKTIREDIHINQNLSPEPLFIKADIGQIEQILMNLLINAQEAMPRGGEIVIKTELFINNDSSFSLEKKKYALLSISDSGLGIDESIIKNIFEPFFTTKGQENTGLGLASVYGIVTQHNGLIETYSELEKGTTFKVYLPLEEDKLSLKKLNDLEISYSDKKEKILVVEDDQNVRVLTEKILIKLGYLPVAYENSNDAINYLKENKESVKLLLTDVIMPDMNGKELHDIAKQIKPQLKVLFMSGYSGNIILDKGINEKDAFFISKPFKITTISQKIKEILK